jgi:hypothetical protein
MPAAYLIIGRAVQYLFGATLDLAAGRVLKVAVPLVLLLLASAQVVALVLMAQFVAANRTTGGFGAPLGHYLQVADRAVTLAQEADAAEVVVVGQGNSTVVDDEPTIFDALLRGRVAYRFVDGDSGALFPSHRSVVLLTPNANPGAIWYGQWPGESIGDVHGDYRLVELDGAWPNQAIEVVEGPRLFQNGVEVQGFQWQNGASLGEDDRLWVLWQVLWLPAEDSHFSARIVEDGELVVQQDVPGLPRDSRAPGDRVLTGFDISRDVELQGRNWQVTLGQYTYPDVQSILIVDAAGNPVSDVIILEEMAGAE